MKKVLNLTKNEMDDVIDEVHDDRVERHELFTTHGKTHYQTAHNHPLWGRDDEYKVVDV